MSIPQDLPFPRGKTYFGTSTPEIDTKSTDFEGREYEVEDKIWTPGSTYGNLRSSLVVRLKIVRNVSGVTLFGKRLVAYAAGYHGKRVDTYNRLSANPCHAIDEYLPSGGVANNDLFYVVTEGPAIVLSPNAATGADWNQGDLVAGLTGSTTSGTTSNATNNAGRFFNITASAITGDALTLKFFANAIGRAMSAGTTAQTATEFLIDIHRW